MYERLEQCPICKSGVFNNFMICKDHAISKESFAIVQCKKCQFKFTNPRPVPESLPKYYQSENYISHTNKGNNLVNLAYKIARHFTIKNKIKFIRTFHDHGNILDYGCGTGIFIESAKRKGWNVLGIEPNEAARSHTSPKMQPFVYSDIRDIKLKKYFHIITLWHVLEHISDLQDAIKKLKKLLHQDGKIIIAVPNTASWDAQYYKEYWAGYDVPRHMYHFTPTSMNNLLAQYKLKIDATYPMTLDAYYVSLLSEKYKYGKNNYIEAIKNGYKSNKWAKKNNNNFSSIIFVASLA